MDHKETGRQNDITELSITIPLLKSKEIEIHFLKRKNVLREKIKRGEVKVFYSSNGCLIVRYDDKTGKLYYAFMDRKGIKELGEI